MLIYFIALWNILQTLGIFFDHLVHFVSFGTFFRLWYQEKSGNPGRLQNGITLNARKKKRKKEFFELIFIVNS
jgi:hypothetical protein